MANEVYANGMEIACKAGAGKTICAMPDVVFTPPENPATPPGVPVPYPNTGFASDTTEGSKTVKISGEEIMLKNKSCFKKSTGDEAGAAAKKGVISSKNTGKVYFIKWSMDVKFEGENVDRHLDMTTNNHGSPANEAVPWPFTDAIAMAKDDHPCKEMAEAIVANCTGDMDWSKKCCNARKCFLMPKSPNRCCNGSDGNQMTGHHLLPSKEFVAHESRGSADPATNYVSNKAPTICLEGHDHNKKKEHGKVGCNYTVEKNKWVKNPLNKNKKYSLKNGCGVAAQSAIGKVKVPAGSKGCDKACLAKQLEEGHSKMGLTVKAHDSLPQPVARSKGRAI
ncbi:hypothetical protein MGMO_120c00280 [Methyloglobulus morosus KoM1]|uniref:Tox-GHH2 domain-containing protein n=1 Tax=Methyloglobulus morosus KoM1 TaxID=1116472 RepID=V5DTA7_9GAMM|nr:PAAR-like domain-containing protein [Methyloglobulus morosus]ESS70641.1 hypothetical protein MGMO_120c00280 [Methyloglobulus morosus KoM1]